MLDCVIINIAKTEPEIKTKTEIIGFVETVKFKQRCTWSYFYFTNVINGWGDMYVCDSQMIKYYSFQADTFERVFLSL